MKKLTQIRGRFYVAIVLGFSCTLIGCTEFENLPSAEYHLHVPEMEGIFATPPDDNGVRNEIEITFERVRDGYSYIGKNTGLTSAIPFEFWVYRIGDTYWAFCMKDPNGVNTGFCGAKLEVGHSQFRYYPIKPEYFKANPSALPGVQINYQNNEVRIVASPAQVASFLSLHGNTYGLVSNTPMVYDRLSGIPTGNVVPSNVESSTLSFLVLCLVHVVLSAVVCVFISNAFMALPPNHRKIQGGLIWLLLIPLFSLVWNFWVFLKIPKSYQSYFSSQNRVDVGDCGWQIGLWYSILSPIALFSEVVPELAIAAVIAAIVLLVVFIVKVTKLKGKISQKIVINV